MLYSISTGIKSGGTVGRVSDGIKSGDTVGRVSDGIKSGGTVGRVSDSWMVWHSGLWVWTSSNVPNVALSM